MGYHAYDALWAAKRAWRRRTISPEVRAAARERVTAAASTPPSELFGAAQGRNVIVIQVESLQGFALGLRTAGGEVTPNLNALARESIVFPEFYHQTGVGHTADAEFAVNCSLLPPGSIPAANEYADRVLGCLPRLLGTRGYHTRAFQVLQPDYWNAAAIERAMGFDRSYSGRDFVIDEKIGMGLSDESMFRQMVAKLDSLPRPYYAFILTVTSHSPFDYPQLPPFDVGELQGDLTGHYLRAVHYTDAAIGQFVRALRAKGVLDSAVLVIYGDHDGVTRRTAPELARLLGISPSDERGWLEAERRIPLLIRLPGGAHAGSQPRLGGQIDIAPTLLGLLGIPRTGDALLGRDLLAPGASGEMVAFPTGSVLTPDRLWATGAGDRCYGREGVLPTSRCSDLAGVAGTELTLSAALTDAETITWLAARVPSQAAPKAHGLQVGR
jgi:phosphoglycerol transferase MdoB-like AlkP superfamily enzyme